MDSLKLTIPTQQDGQHILVETDPGRLAKWLHSLPLADMSKTLPEITRAIASLNRTELPYKLRSELVQHFDRTYRLIHDYFRPRPTAVAGGRNKDQENIEHLHVLTREMAFAHKIIVNDASKKRSIWGRNKLKIRAIAYAIHYLGLMLVEQYEKYTPIPIYLWREVNALFAHAGKEEIEHEPLDTGETYCLPTIEQNYVRNSLIALADPYHLAQGEHWQVFYYLQHWVHLARISEDPDDFRKTECFIIDVTSENKPNFVTSELDDPEDPKIRLLLTYDLIRQIEYDLESFEEKNKLPEKSFHRSIRFSTAKYLWEHLAKHWKQRIERGARRYPIVTRVDVVWGLDDISRVLSQSKQRGRKALSTAEVLSITTIKSAEHLTWDAINVSAGGIGLCSRQFMIPYINLGDLALVREYMDGKPAPHWRLALCRWHTGDEHNGTMLGLKYIEGRYTPVRLILHQGRNERGGQPGIVVSDTIVEGSNSATLITARGAYKEGRVYAMLGYNEPVEIRPRMTVEITPCIERFFYQTYELRDELAEEVQEEVSDVIPWTAIPHEKGNLNDSFTVDEDTTKIATLDDLRFRDKLKD